MPTYYQPMYQAYQPPMADQLTQLRQHYQQQSPIIWVQGEEAAKAYLVAPGSTVMLMDSEKQAFYLKSSDAQGMPLPLRVFDYTERGPRAPQETPAPTQGGDFVTREEFNALAARFDALMAKKAKEEAANESAISSTKQK